MDTSKINNSMAEEPEQELVYHASAVLHIGDYITLKLSGLEPDWLSSEGLLDAETFVTPNTDNFDDCIWELHVQNQYSATREYREALLIIKQGDRVTEDNIVHHSKLGSHRHVTKEHLDHLQRAAVNEQRLNEKLMKVKVGKPVAFGDPVQLRHVKSRKFLTVSSNVLAQIERENMRVSVESEGNSLSCLGFLPKNRFDKEGQVLTNNAEVMVRIHDRRGEFLHASTTYIPCTEGDGERAEVNCSLEQSVWTIGLFQRVLDRGKNISAGQLITLQDPDSLSCVSLQEINNIHNDIEIESLAVVMSPQFQVKEVISESAVGTNLLWFVEKAAVSVGGPIYLSSDRLTLRHFNSGMFMRILDDGRVRTTRDRKEASLLEVSSTSSAGAMSSRTNAVLIDEAGINIGLVGEKPAWLMQGGAACLATTDKGKSTSLIASSFLSNRIGFHVHVGVRATRTLRQLTNMTRLFGENKTQLRDFTAMVRLAMSTLDSLSSFLAIAEESGRRGNDDAVHIVSRGVNKDSKRLRQNMMREQGLLDCLLDILKLTESGIFNRIEVMGPRKTRRMRPSFMGRIGSSQVLNEFSQTAAIGVTTTSEANRMIDDELDCQPVHQVSQKRRLSISLFPSRQQPQASNGVENNSNTGASRQHRQPRGSILLGSSNYNGSPMPRTASNDEGSNTVSRAVGNFIQMQSLSRSTNPAPMMGSSGKMRNKNRGRLPSIDFAGEQEADENENGVTTTQDSNNSQSSALMATVSNEVAEKVLRVLFALLVDNFTNQLHCADRLSVLLEQVKTQRMAVLCVQEMLKENLQILQTKITKTEVDLLVTLLKESEMSVTFLRLIQSTCSCPKGVDATQRMVAYALFGAAAESRGSTQLTQSRATVETSAQHRFSTFKRAVSRKGNLQFRPAKSDIAGTLDDETEGELLIKIVVDRSRPQVVEWGDLSLYCPVEPEKNVDGYWTLARGLPELFLEWSMSGKNGEYDMVKLFGHGYGQGLVPLPMVCSTMRTSPIDSLSSSSWSSSLVGNNRQHSSFESVSAKTARRAANIFQAESSKSTSGANTIVTLASYRAQVAEYFATQLYLVADLCLDRNYVSIALLENMYEYDVLVAMLKTPMLPNGIKAAVGRIVRCLYVDREPQVAAKFPRFIRTSVALGLLDSQYSLLDNGNNNQVDEIGGVDSSHSLYRFALLQKLISDYLTSNLDLKRCDDMSIEMMQLLKALVNFGFYTTIPQILDILRPLLEILDQHTRNDNHSDKAMDVDTSADFISPRGGSRKSNNHSMKGNNLSNERRELLRSAAGSTSRQVSYQQVLPADQVESMRYAGSVSIKSDRSDDDSIASSNSWAMFAYRITDSIIWMIIVLLIVIATVAIALVQIFVNSFAIPYFFVLTTVFFGIELSLRGLAHVFALKNARFCMDPLNFLDLALVVIDVVTLSIGSGNAGTTASKGIRIIRVIRIARLVRAARLINRIANKQVVRRYKVPPRYSTVTTTEATTMVTMLQVLAMIYDRVQDRQLDIAIKAFSAWTQEQQKRKKDDQRTGNVSNRSNNSAVTGSMAIETYHRYLASEENIPSTVLERFDHILLDIIMYSDTAMTQEALQLLMIHKSQRDRFLSIAEKVQIVCSPRVEAICKNLGTMLRELRSLAEMFEIWGELATEEDRKTANRVYDTLDSIQGYLAKRNEDRTLGIRSEILVDEEVQSLMRNLDAMSSFIALQESLFNGVRGQLPESIRKMLKVCNKVICYFVKNSEENQTAAFRYLSWFVERVDDDIASANVVRAILEGNKALIKLTPRQYLNDFVQKIITNGRKPEYLQLFIGMTELSSIADSRVPAVENEIGSYLTAREFKKHVLLWCAPAASDEYLQRKRAMERYARANAAPPTLEDLSPDLQYHVGIVTLLSCCNLGPKLNAIYAIDDVLVAILDDMTVFPVRKAIGKLLVEVLRTSSDRLEKSYAFWNLLEKIASTWESIPTEVVLLSKSPVLRIQRGEWLEITAEIALIFFENFDLDSFLASQQQLPSAISSRNSNDTIGNGNSKTVAITNDPKVIMERLRDAAVRLTEDPSRVGSALKGELDFVYQVLMHHLEDQHDDYNDQDDDGLFDLNETKLKLLRVQHQRSSVIYADVQQVMLRKNFKVFIKAIKGEHADSKKEEVIDFLNRIPWIDSHHSNHINTTANTHDSDVRFEPLIKKICSHFRSKIRRSPLSRSLEESSVEVCVWFLRALRHLFESVLGDKFTCDALDDIDADMVNHDNDKKLTHLRSVFNDNGVTYLCLDLIAVGVEHELYIEAMKLLVAMLLRRGGCPEIQQRVFYYLQETDSFLFFELLRDMIESMKQWSIRENEANAKVPTPEDIMSLYLIQHLCTGSGRTLANRNQFREQTGNSKVVNLLDSLASYVGILSRTDSLPNVYIAIVLLRGILRLVQGPCRGNQEQFVLHTELLISLNRIIRSARPTLQSMSRIWAECLEELKEGIVDVLRGLIEGQGEMSLVFDRVTTTVDFSVLHVLLLPEEQDTAFISTLYNNKAQYSKAQAKYLVFAKSMGRTVQALQNLDDKLEQHEEEVCRVEVVWTTPNSHNSHHHSGSSGGANGQQQMTHVVYFHIPTFLKDISAESKHRVLDEIKDFASRELKLSDFIKQIKALWRESGHQQFLKGYGLSSLWTIKYYLTRFMFVNAIAMNSLILAYYGAKKVDQSSSSSTSHHHHHHHHRALSSTGAYSETAFIETVPYISEEARKVIEALNVFQLLLALATVVIFAVVKAPVNYLSELERISSSQPPAVAAKVTGNKSNNSNTNANNKFMLNNRSLRWLALVQSILDPLIIWYIAYLVFTMLGLIANPLFLSALLLDWIVLDTTTQDLLKAVQYPARQLLATLCIILIMLTIFAGIEFFFYRQDVVTVAIYNVWDALKLCISYGFRGEYGVDHEMLPTLNERLVLDVAFYFIILSILRHIFFAIIVDTFGKLREIKFEREQEDKNSCFICGIERHDFDRLISAGSTNGFLHHRNVSHDPIAYLYFIMSIWQKSPTEDSSVEMHVRDCLARGDVSWFPTGVLLEAIATPAVMIDDELFSQSKLDDSVLDHHASNTHGGGNGSSSNNGGHGQQQAHYGGGGSGHHNLARRGSMTNVNGTDHTSIELLEKMHVMHRQLAKIAKALPTNSGSLPTNSSVTYPTAASAAASMDITAIMAGANGGTAPFFRDQSVSKAIIRAALATTTDDDNAATTTTSGIAMEDNHQPQRSPINSYRKQMTGGSGSVEQLEQSITKIGDTLTQFMQRMEKMENRFGKSHKFIRHRVRDLHAVSKTSGGGAVGDAVKKKKPPGPSTKLAAHITAQKKMQQKQAVAPPKQQQQQIPQSGKQPVEEQRQPSTPPPNELQEALLGWLEETTSGKACKKKNQQHDSPADSNEKGSGSASSDSSDSDDDDELSMQTRSENDEEEKDASESQHGSSHHFDQAISSSTNNDKHIRPKSAAQTRTENCKATASLPGPPRHLVDQWLGSSSNNK